MLNIASILTHVHNGINQKDPRYVIRGDEHIMDTKTGAVFHVYDSWFKVTYDEKVIVTKEDFTPEEQNIFWKIKTLITDPNKLEQNRTNYIPLQKARRNAFSKVYEEPHPVHDETPKVAEPEQGAVPYRG